MSKITAVIIAKDEEEMIADCLDSILFCDEIIVIDSGSKDRTKEIAEKMSASVFVHKTDDFSEMRNFGLRKAKGEWILYIDADERVTPALRDEIKFLILDSRSKSAYKIKRKNYYLGNHEWPYIEKIERLFKKNKLKEWRGELHESPVIEGEVGESENYLLHYTHRDLSSMLKKTIKWSKIEAQLRFKANHPKMTLWRFPRVSIGAFYDSYIRQKGYKAGTAGLIESMYQTFSIFITYARLWELQRLSKSRRDEKNSY